MYMRNRAKCKVCNDVIESFHRHDYVTCKCESIAVDGGQDYFRCRANNWSNFIRLDDDGNEVIPQIVDNDPKPAPIVDMPPKKPTKEEILDTLKNMIRGIEELPPHAQHSFCTNYDLLSFMLVVAAALDCKDES